MSERKPKFRVGQVVLIHSNCFGVYPIKLLKKTRISTRPTAQAWIDSLGNFEYEEDMRPLTKREAGR